MQFINKFVCEGCGLKITSNRKSEPVFICPECSSEIQKETVTPLIGTEISKGKGGEYSLKNGEVVEYYLSWDDLMAELDKREEVFNNGNRKT